MAECYLRPFNALLDTIAAIVSIWFSYKFITTERVHTQDRCLYVMVLIFVVLIAFTFISWAIFSAFYCVYPEMIIVPRLLGNAGFVVQYITLVVILWRRLCFVFKGSAFAVSIRTKSIFWSAYIFQIVLGVASLMVSYRVSMGNMDGIWAKMHIIPAIALLWVMFLVSALVGLFIYKLMMISRISTDLNDTDTNREIRSVVTKLFILTLASSVSCFIMLVIALVVSRLGSGINVYLASFYKMALTIDTFTNNLSIILGITCLNDYYMTVCGWCQTKCVECWAQKADKTVEARLAKQSNAQTLDIEPKSTSEVPSDQIQTQISV